MRFLLQYIRIEYKRMLSMLWRMLLSMLLTGVLIGGGAAGISAAMTHLADYEKITVAMVLPESDAGSTLKLFSGLIQSQESVSDTCTFEYMTQQEAEAGMKDGSIQAAILLGDTFLNDVMTGINTPAIVYLPENSALNTEVFHEEIEDGVSLIRTGEAAIYSVTEAGLGIQEMVIDRNDMENLLTDLYMQKALERNDLMELKMLSAFGDTSVAGYYTAAGLSVLLLLFGMTFSGLYTGRDLTVRKKLRVNGIGAGTTGMVRILVMTSVLTAVTFLLLWILRLYREYGSGVYIAPIDGTQVLGVLALAFSLAGFFHLIYSLSVETTKNAMLLLLVAAFMVLVSGCIFPMAFLPDKLQLIGNYVPMRLWRESVSAFLSARLQTGGIFRMLLLGIIFGLGGIVCQIRKLHA